MDPATERLVVQPSGYGAGQTARASRSNPTTAPAGRRSRAGRPNHGVHEPHLGARLRDGAERVPPRAHDGLRRLRAHRSRRATRRSTTTPRAPSSTARRPVLAPRHARPAGSEHEDVLDVNDSPDSVLQIYSLKARKGLPLGFEITGALGYLANSSLWMLGGDFRWAPFEGFRTGAGGILPDISVGGGVRTVIGTDKFTLTTVGIDVELSKPIALASTFVAHAVRRLPAPLDLRRLDRRRLDAERRRRRSVRLHRRRSDDRRAHLQEHAPERSVEQRRLQQQLRLRESPHAAQPRHHRARLPLRDDPLRRAVPLRPHRSRPAKTSSSLQSTRQWTISFEAGVFF